MLTLLLALQLVTSPPAATATDSVYGSARVRALVTAAAANNRRVPAGLDAYDARVESEIALLLRRADGSAEGATSLEQVASSARWSRAGTFDQRVIGYRSRQAGINVSTLGFFRSSWIVPVLYGNRMSLLFGRDPDSARTARRRNPRTARDSARLRDRPPTITVHPLADDREGTYEYSGGDTAVTMRVGGRLVPIVRVQVTPRHGLPVRTVAFEGELDIDATRAQLVRMRGHFIAVGPPRTRSLARRLQGSAVDAVAFVELVNAEVDGRYWLPAYQRIEGQIEFALAGDARSIMRVVSRFRDYDIAGAPEREAVTNALASGDSMALAHSASDSSGTAAGDTLVVRLHRLGIAPSDSLARYDGWNAPLGEATTADLRADDFDDVAPARWRTTGAPQLRWRPERFSDLVRYNRVEGAFTGASAELRLRDRAPGLSLRGTAGWAWREETVRGRASAELRRGAWLTGLRAGRSLDLTNDFRNPFDSSGTLAALLGRDDYDYVDRRSATLMVTRAFGRERESVLRLEGGVASDRVAQRHEKRSPLGSRDFRENRPVAPGRYVRFAITAERAPGVASGFVQPGVGTWLRYEQGVGDLDWGRLEGRIVSRSTRGPVTLLARLDGGVLIAQGSSAPPPQQLFEIGENQGLPGYAYKEFAGDQAALARGVASLALPMLRAPIRLPRVRWIFPAIAPALAASVQSGWTGASDAGARASIGALATGDSLLFPRSAVPRITGNARASVELGVRLFGGGVALGVARPVDRQGPWRFRFAIGQDF